MTALFDSNILIDYLHGIPQARQTVQKHRRRYISFITRIEVMVGAQGTKREQKTRDFLDSFIMVHSDSEICETALNLRMETKLKLPDALIWACARKVHATLLTRNTRDFPRHAADVVIPYQLN